MIYYTYQRKGETNGQDNNDFRFTNSNAEGY